MFQVLVLRSDGNVKFCLLLSAIGWCVAALCAAFQRSPYCPLQTLSTIFGLTWVWILPHQPPWEPTFRIWRNLHLPWERYIYILVLRGMWQRTPSRFHSISDKTSCQVRVEHRGPSTLGCAPSTPLTAHSQNLFPNEISRVPPWHTEHPSSDLWFLTKRRNIFRCPTPVFC